MNVDNGNIQLPNQFDLVFNPVVHWTEKLKQLYYKEPALLYAGGGTDEYSFDLDFSKKPLSIKNEIDNIHQYYDDWATEHLLYPGNDGLYQDLSHQIDYNKQYFSSLMERKQYVDGAIFEIIEG